MADPRWRSVICAERRIAPVGGMLQRERKKAAVKLSRDETMGGYKYFSRFFF